MIMFMMVAVFGRLCDEGDKIIILKLCLLDLIWVAVEEPVAHSCRRIVCSGIAITKGRHLIMMTMTLMTIVLVMLRTMKWGLK